MAAYEKKARDSLSRDGRENAMSERVVTLDVESIDEIVAELEREFSAQDVPTLLRLRASMLTEEVFSAVREVVTDTAKLRCTFPSPQTMVLQYRDKDGALKPDLSMAARLTKNPCTDGVSVAFHEGSCTVTIDRPGS